MKKYTKPELTFMVFDCEDVMALSMTSTSVDYTKAAGVNADLKLNIVDVSPTADSQFNPFN